MRFGSSVTVHAEMLQYLKGRECSADHEGYLKSRMCQAIADKILEYYWSEVKVREDFRRDTTYDLRLYVKSHKEVSENLQYLKAYLDSSLRGEPTKASDIYRKFVDILTR